MTEKKLVIQVVFYSTHSHYGGDHKELYNYRIDQGKEAESKYFELQDLALKSSGYCHASISIMEVKND